MGTTSQTPAPLPVEITRKIRRSLFLGDHDFQVAEPVTLGGRLARAAGRGVHWFLLVLAIVNLILVVFDFTYLELRPQYLRFAPDLVTLYDPVKGAAPHRTTETYISRADLTLRRLEAGDRGAGTLKLLQEMRERSNALFQEDPFSGAGLSGVFEQVKNRMRRHMRLESAKQGFSHFWSLENLATPERVRSEARFFRDQIRPLLHRNYYRGLGEDGRPFNAFWLIDLWFVPFFAAEFLLRGLAEVRHSPRFPSWKAYAYAHWYDLFYFVPLVQYVVPFGQSGWIHLFRVFSVGHRMRRLGLLNPVEVPQQYAAQALDLVTDLVSVRLLSNYQDSVRRFDLGEVLASITPEQRETFRALAEQHAAVLVREVLPAIREDLKTLATMAAREAMASSPSYQSFRRIPLLGDWPERHLEAIVAEVVDGAETTLRNAVGSAEYRAVVDRMVDRATEVLIQHAARLKSEETLKAMIVDMLEEQKRKLLA